MLCKMKNIVIFQVILYVGYTSIIAGATEYVCQDNANSGQIRNFFCVPISAATTTYQPPTTPSNPNDPGCAKIVTCQLRSPTLQTTDPSSGSLRQVGNSSNGTSLTPATLADKTITVPTGTIPTIFASNTTTPIATASNSKGKSTTESITTASTSASPTTAKSTTISTSTTDATTTRSSTTSSATISSSTYSTTTVSTNTSPIATVLSTTEPSTSPTAKSTTTFPTAPESTTSTRSSTTPESTTSTRSSTSPESTITFPTTTKSPTSTTTTPKLTTKVPTTPESTTTFPTTTESTTTFPTTTESPTSTPATAEPITTVLTVTESTIAIPTTTESPTAIPTAIVLTSDSPALEDLTTTIHTTTGDITTVSNSAYTTDFVTPVMDSYDTVAYSRYRRKRELPVNQAVLQNGDTVDHCFSSDTFTVTHQGTPLWCREILRDHCISNPCFNDATCVSEQYEYRCICAQGFKDRQCRTQINLCENYPCDPFGTCTDFLNGYNCSCKSGFKKVSETYCEDIDECQLLKASGAGLIACQSNSTCSNYPGGYECLCPQDRLGRYCERQAPPSGKVSPDLIDVFPTFGLMAGGGLLNFTGRNVSFYPAMGAYFLPKNERLDALYGRTVDVGNTTDRISIRIPRAPSTDYVGQKMSLVIKYSQYLNLTIDGTYTYTGNPDIFNITPSDARVEAGIRITVRGRNMNSVSDAKLNLFLVQDQNLSIYTTPCFGVDEEIMICLLPAIKFPSTNQTANRRKRSSIGGNQFAGFLDRMSGWFGQAIGRSRSRGKRDVVPANDTSNRRYYLGIVLDDFPKYTNLSRSFPSYKFTALYDLIKFKSPSESGNFDPRTGEAFKIRSDELYKGWSKEDYNVSIGTGVCTIFKWQKNQLLCSPPKVEPRPGPKAALRNCSDTLPVIVYIGTSENFYQCVKYVREDWKSAVVIGLSVGLAGLLVLVVFLAWLRCTARQRMIRRRRDEDDRNSMSRRLGVVRSNDTYRRMEDPADTLEEAGKERESVTDNYFDHFYGGENKTAAAAAAAAVADTPSVGSRGRGFYDVDGTMKRKVYKDMLNPRDRISYTRPKRWDEVEVSYSDTQLKKSYANQAYQNSGFQSQPSDA